MRYFISLLMAFILSACASEDVRTADTLYTNGIIWTGTGEATSFAVKDGLISYVGNDKANMSASETIDLGGRFVMPGFIDNHVHFFEGGTALASVDLRDAVTPDEFTQRITDFSETLPAGRWILTGNWDHENWGGELPRKDWIDAGTQDTPVMVTRLDGHMALANSAALNLAGITAQTPTPEGGEIIRDANGDPTGVLKDNAMNLVFAVVPKPSDDEILETFKLAQAHALSLGLTEVHAVTASPNETTMLSAFHLAQTRGAMKLRVQIFTPLEHWQDARDYVAANGSSNGKLSWGGVKGLVDGSLGSTTAWFYDPYTDGPDKSGFALIKPDDLKTLLSGADEAGLKLAIHGIGDKAIDLIIDNMKTITGNDISARRFRIEHFQHPSRAAIKAAADNGIIASMQPYHAIDDGRWAEKRIGPERIKTTYAFRSILDAGGILTFGSDWPVAPLSPLEGVYAAVTRQTTDGTHPNGWQPQEKISVEEALTAYTLSNAYAGFTDDTGGTLEVGKRADFIILSDDPRKIDPAAIQNINVLQTIIDGETVYQIEN